MTDNSKAVPLLLNNNSIEGLTDNSRDPKPTLGPKSVIQSLFYTYLSPVINQGSKEPYSNSALFEVPTNLIYRPNHSTHTPGTFNVLTNQNKITYVSVAKTIKSYLLKMSAASLIGSLCYLVVPLKMKALIRWLGDQEDSDPRHIATDLVILIICFFCYSYSSLPRLMNAKCSFMQMKNALSVLLVTTITAPDD